MGQLAAMVCSICIASSGTVSSSTHALCVSDCSGKLLRSLLAQNLQRKARPDAPLLYLLNFRQIVFKRIPFCVRPRDKAPPNLEFSLTEAFHPKQKTPFIAERGLIIPITLVLYEQLLPGYFPAGIIYFNHIYPISQLRHIDPAFIGSQDDVTELTTDKNRKRTIGTAVEPDFR